LFCVLREFYYKRALKSGNISRFEYAKLSLVEFSQLSAIEKIATLPVTELASLTVHQFLFLDSSICNLIFYCSLEKISLVRFAGIIIRQAIVLIACLGVSRAANLTFF